MKRYKLKRDLPTFKAGDMFHLIESGSLIHDGDNIVTYSWSTIDKFPNILTDWFEEIKEPTRWKPEMRQYYSHVMGSGMVLDDVWSNYDTDRKRLEIGNCFQTREEAEQAVEYLKALAVVKGDATTKFVEGGENWIVFYNANDNALHLDCNFSHIRNGVFGLPYFATKEDAQRSIEQHRNEWLTIFGVEEEE